MILAVKKKSKNRNIFKIVLLIAVFLAAGAIYYKYEEISALKIELQKEEDEKNLSIKIENEKIQKERQDAERIILIEVEKVVDLIGQENIQDIKIIKNKVVYVCKPNIKIDAITIRYGAMALVKRSFKEIVIVVDLEHILKGRLSWKIYT